MYTEQVSQGTITLAPTEDVLTLALGKDVHCGRVRGVGFGELLKRCTLFWSDKEHEVAKGCVFIPREGCTSMLHCQQLDSNQVLKVNLDNVLPGCGAVSVPYPNDEVWCMSDAPGYIIGWPTTLVVIEPDSAQSFKSSRASRVEPMQVDNHTSLQPPRQSDLVQSCLSLLSKNNRFVLEITMQKEILQHSHTLFMGNDEVVRCLKDKKLDEAHISFYMKFLYDSYKPSSHSFFCPSCLGVIRDKKGNIVQPKDDQFDMRAIYLTSSICQDNAIELLWLAPYNGG